MRRYALMTAPLLLLAACSSGDPTFDDAMASLEAKVPTQERASVRVCEALVAPDGQMTSFAEVVAFVTSGLEDVSSSDDPNGMKSALSQALISVGDAAVLEDAAAYEPAVMTLGTVCMDILSGEYGK